MAARAVFTCEAESDISDAFDWYESKRAGLGEDFLLHIGACVNAVCSAPTRFPPEKKDYRRARVRKFPYLVVYKFKDEIVTIVAVRHAARDPVLFGKRYK